LSDFFFLQKKLLFFLDLKLLKQDVKKRLFELIAGKFEDKDVMEHENISHVIYEVI